MKLVALRKSEQNQAAIDPWTVVHFGTGLAAGLTETPLRWAMLAAVAYEVIEQYAERRDDVQKLFRISGAERLPNVAVDLVVFAAGHWLGKAWNRSGREGGGGQSKART